MKAYMALHLDEPPEGKPITRKQALLKALQMAGIDGHDPRLLEPPTKRQRTTEWHCSKCDRKATLEGVADYFWNSASQPRLWTITGGIVTQGPCPSKRDTVPRGRLNAMTRTGSGRITP